MNRILTIEDPKPPGSEFLVEIDITKWLDGENISDVSFSAKDMDTGKTVTSTVLNSNKNTFTNKIIKPFIQAGSSGARYCVTMQVTTSGTPAAVESWYLIFSIDDNIPEIGPI